MLYFLSVPRGDTEIPQRVRLATQAYLYYSALLGGLAYVYVHHHRFYLHSILALPARLVLNTRRPNVGHRSHQKNQSYGGKHHATMEQTIRG